MQEERITFATIRQWAETEDVGRLRKTAARKLQAVVEAAVELSPELDDARRLLAEPHVYAKLLLEAGMKPVTAETYVSRTRGLIKDYRASTSQEPREGGARPATPAAEGDDPMPGCAGPPMRLAEEIVDAIHALDRWPRLGPRIREALLSAISEALAETEALAEQPHGRRRLRTD